MVMSNLLVTKVVLERVGQIWARKGSEVYDEILGAFPDQPDIAYAFTIGLAISSTLSEFHTARARTALVNAMNVMARHMGYELTRVGGAHSDRNIEARRAGRPRQQPDCATSSLPTDCRSRSVMSAQ
jgi:hypothetical protein